MVIIRESIQFQSYVRQHSHISNIGFVPTMGALHNGHLSLIYAAKAQCTHTVVSIFVNPSQFNNLDDYNNYPVTLDSDIQLLEHAGCDILYLPAVQEIYPGGIHSLEQYELGSLETLLEGKYRPGHFQGVCQVMSRLLRIIGPNHLYMGTKDFQQCMVVKKLLNLMDLPVTLHTCPTLREPDGLAMSSRNIRLNATQRKQAVAIYQQLGWIATNLDQMPLSQLIETAGQGLMEAGFASVDYVSIAIPDTLQQLDHYNPANPAVILIAAYLGEVRLIDNMLIVNHLSGF